MDGAIETFCARVVRHSSLNMKECGINEEWQQLVFGLAVRKVDNDCLLKQLEKYPSLRHIVGKKVVKKEDVSRYYINLANETEQRLPGRVTLVTCNEGLLRWVERKDDLVPYGIVNSVDLNMQFHRGIAKVIKEKFGGNNSNYVQVSQQPGNLINHGECFTYDCIRGDKPSDLNNCRAVHNVLVPLANDGRFAEKLEKTFFELFKAADVHPELSRIYCPLLSCGLAGGTGKDLAEAISKAKAKFESTGRQAPELILVGRSSAASDRTACRDFASRWDVLAQRNSATGSPVRSVTTPAAMSSSAAVATAINTAASTGRADKASTELFPNQLEIAMHPDKGMFGRARELSKQGKPFDLVNAANREMRHSGGVAGQFSSDLGAQFNHDTSIHKVGTGKCYTTGPYGYATDSTRGLRHCQHIHNVVAPNKKDYDLSVNRSGVGVEKYQRDFTNAFVSLLLGASDNGSNTIVSCFIGCAIFGGSGEDMARALHAAYQDPRIQKLSKVPKLILVGWDNKNNKDKEVHDDFIKAFKSLNAAKPVHLPTGITPVGTHPAGVSGTMLAVGHGAIPKKTASYFQAAQSGAVRSEPAVPSRSQPQSRVSTPADSPIPKSAARLFSHPVGVLGFARRYYGNSEPFSLVNAVQKPDDLLKTDVALQGGAREGYIEHMIVDGGQATFNSKGYYQCEAWLYKETEGFKGCQKIHSVLFPKVTDISGFSQQLVTLIINAASEKRLVFPLYELGGATDSELKAVLKQVYSDPKVLSMARQGTLPKLYFVDK
ncbi:macro domain-containing protein [Salinisphaera sp. G21_0]|uniref:macro domain-containing protein n=1 Tax=Salinisphaera sp. G21_0 TaxID=2821094 RepID=UPI001ADA5B60|nr:macro domain-containing protein [Salinisphaera sp. G21_0]MBO9483167.1 macro domain-containing protein [Salinisphaera sp. G21_0]